MAFIQLGWVSRVDEMILARVSSGFAGEKVWDDIQVVPGFLGAGKRAFGEVGRMVLEVPEIIATLGFSEAVVHPLLFALRLVFCLASQQLGINRFSVRTYFYAVGYNYLQWNYIQHLHDVDMSTLNSASFQEHFSVFPIAADLDLRNGNWLGGHNNIGSSCYQELIILCALFEMDGEGMQKAVSACTSSVELAWLYNPRLGYGYLVVVLVAQVAVAALGFFESIGIIPRGNFGLRCQEDTDDYGIVLYQSQVSASVSIWFFLLVALVDDKLAMKTAAALGPSSTSESYASSWLTSKIFVVVIARAELVDLSSFEHLNPCFEQGIEINLQKAVKESLKDVHAAHQGLLPPVVIREPESGKFQPFLEVQGKGKEKVSEEQAAQVLLNLQNPKKKSPADQYVFQRRNSAPTEPSGHDESSSLYAELGLTDSETESDEDVPGIEAGDQDEGQAGPNPGIQDEGQAGSNPGDAAISQPQPSHVVHDAPNLEHMDVEENLKLPTEDQVRLEEPASSAGTLSSLRNLDKEFSFTNKFLEEKSPEDEPNKTNTESEVQSMVMVPIHQDTSSAPLMTTPVIDLTVSQPVSTTVQAPLPTSTITRIGELEQHMADLLQDNLALEERLDKHGSRLYKLENLDIPHQVSKVVDEIVTGAVDWAIQAPLKDRFRDLPEADMKEILHHRMWETKSYEAHEDHKNLYEALENSMDRDHSDQLLTDLAEARRKKKRRHESPKTPLGSPPHQPPPPPPPEGPSGTSGASGAFGLSQLPPPPPPLSTNQSDQSKSTAAPSSLKTTTSAEYTAWTTTDIILKPSVSSIPEDLHMDVDSAPDE
ncbi:hypothetical protein Tco_0634802 [Tanacetum coccineum]